METTTVIGTEDEAKELANVLKLNRFSRHVIDGELPFGWKYISSGAWRDVYHAPSGTVYKVQHSRSSRHGWKMNSGEIDNWKSLSNNGLGEHVPTHQLFTIKVGRTQVEITAVEYIPFEGYSKWPPYELESKVERWVSDLSSINFYWSENKGTFIVVDAGNGA
jgi:hypothetical protein